MPIHGNNENALHHKLQIGCRFHDHVVAPAWRHGQLIPSFHSRLNEKYEIAIVSDVEVLNWFDERNHDIHRLFTTTLSALPLQQFAMLLHLSVLPRITFGPVFEFELSRIIQCENVVIEMVCRFSYISLMVANGAPTEQVFNKAIH